MHSKFAVRTLAVPESGGVEVGNKFKNIRKLNRTHVTLYSIKNFFSMRKSTNPDFFECVHAKKSSRKIIAKAFH